MQDATRPLFEIAAEIRQTWFPQVHMWAEPYVIAMSTLDQITEMHGVEPGAAVVEYFLANATSWKGSDAVRIKAELSAMLPPRGNG